MASFITRTPRCPSCRHQMNQERSQTYKLGFRWRCRRAGCNIIRSPLKRTFFERSNVSILKTLRLIFHFSRRDKVVQAARDVGVTKKTAIQVYHFLREVCEVAEAHDRTPIGGDDDIVEVDESHLYTNKYHRGRLLQRQMWAFGCMSRKTRQIHIETIPNKTRETLDPIIAQNVQPNSYIMSDLHRAYTGVAHRLGMRGHSAVNHSREFVAGTIDLPVHPSLGRVIRRTGLVRCKIHTNTLERQWLELKRHCRTCRSERRLKWYMGEYMYRQNVLKRLPSDAARFRRLLRDISRVYPGLGRRRIRITNCGCNATCPRQ